MIVLGFLIGFMGYLPPGNINLTAVQLGLDNRQRRLWAFIWFAALMEFMYCYGCIWGINFLLQKPDWVNVLEWSAVVIFAALGVLSLLPSNSKVSSSFSGIRRGIIVAILNPLQIPFWLVWGVYIKQNNWIDGSNGAIALFSIITALGTVAVLWMYALLGKQLVERLKLNRDVLNRIIGALLLILALLQAVKLIW